VDTCDPDLGIEHSPVRCNSDDQCVCHGMRAPAPPCFASCAALSIIQRILGKGFSSGHSYALFTSIAPSIVLRRSRPLCSVRAGITVLTPPIYRPAGFTGTCDPINGCVLTPKSCPDNCPCQEGMLLPPLPPALSHTRTTPTPLPDQYITHSPLPTLPDTWQSQRGA
jgi:hypothetical protein